MANLDSTDIKKLEYLVGELVQVCDQLREENALLRERQGNLVAERARLIEKNEAARNRVESMITRLKSLEREV